MHRKRIEERLQFTFSPQMLQIPVTVSVEILQSRQGAILF